MLNHPPSELYHVKAIAVQSLWEETLFLPQDTENLNKMKIIECNNLDMFFNIKIFMAKSFLLLDLKQIQRLDLCILLTNTWTY